MDQSEALATAETALRSIVRELLGPDWHTRLSQKELEHAEARRVEEPRVRPGALETDDLLSYIDTSILTRLITENWEKFKPVFGNIKRSKVAFEALNVYRRRVAHHRPLLAFERDLLSGISGQIRNQIAIYRQAQNPAPQFYAQIGSAVDQEGRPASTGNAYMLSRDPAPIIRVGETLTFTADAVDPRGRPLEWALAIGEFVSVFVPPYSGEQSTGDSITLNWTPSEKDFASTIYVHLCVRNMSGFYRLRDSQSDDIVYWQYAFEPPY
jgi:hypothetical protein